MAVNWLSRLMYLSWFLALVSFGVAHAQEPADAQDSAPAILVADEVFVTTDNTLVAAGTVEVLFEGQTLRASKITYFEDGERLVLEGPLRMVTAEGTIILADSGDVDAGFTNGLLRSARMVLDEQLQMSAVQLARAEGRYSIFSKVAVTSCQMCGDSGTPLWEIRARRIIHDDLEKQIYLDGAQLRVLNIPLAYIPRLRFPDPSLKRARGFLFPTLRSTSQLGAGIKIPYFIPIGDHKDLTLTPYLSPETTTLEGRYRQAFVNGDIIFNGAVTAGDTIRPGDTRGYLFGEGIFSVWRGYTLTFDIELTTDESYLKEYGYSRNGRLDSAIGLRKVSRDRSTEISLTHFNSLLDNENSSTQPSFVFDALHQKRVFTRMGGELRLEASLHGRYRYSVDDIVGRDVYRGHASTRWRSQGVVGPGVHLTFETGFDLDAVRNLGDSSKAQEDASFAPMARVALRMPFVGSGTSGARYVIEPVVQLGWTGGDKLETANDDSERSELDEGNLLSLSRFSATDRRERGAEMAAGLRWGMISPSGWRAGLAIGRVVRENTRSEFSTTSGLSQATSDWLVAGQVGNGTGLDLVARVLSDDDFSFNRAEARSTWANDRLNLSAAYLLLPEDRKEARNDLVSEWSFDGSYRLSQHWTASANWQYNLAEDRSSNGGIGLEYQNECVVARFEADRDFADSDNLDPTTTFEVTVELKGFSTGGSAGGYRRQCSN
ncbi:MAG: LPS assembly protein LptD [Marinovum sp.]|nr:LPS assembly protein LptD [Marinovum sp.]